MNNNEIPKINSIEALATECMKLQAIIKAQAAAIRDLMDDNKYQLALRFAKSEVEAAFSQFVGKNEQPRDQNGKFKKRGGCMPEKPVPPVGRILNESGKETDESCWNCEYFVKNIIQRENYGIIGHCYLWHGELLRFFVDKLDRLDAVNAIAYNGQGKRCSRFHPYRDGVSQKYLYLFEQKENGDGDSKK